MHYDIMNRHEEFKKLKRIVLKEKFKLYEIKIRKVEFYRVKGFERSSQLPSRDVITWKVISIVGIVTLTENIPTYNHP